MDELTAGQLLGVAPYTIRLIELDLARDVWLVTVRDMCSHTNTVRELPREKATGGTVTGTGHLVGETGPEEIGPQPADAEVVPAAKPKPPRKPKAKP